MSVYKGLTYSNLRAINATVDNLSASVTAIGPLQLATYAVAGLPDAGDHTGALVYVSNGAAGDPVVAFSDGTNWLRVDTKAAVAAA